VSDNEIARIVYAEGMARTAQHDAEIAKDRAAFALIIAGASIVLALAALLWKII